MVIVDADEEATVNRYLDWLEQAERDLSKAELDIRYEYWE